VSNAHIVERLEALAGQLERGEITLADFALQIQGHICALDTLEYSQIKEAQRAAIEIEHAAEMSAAEMQVDISAVTEWLRRWLERVPKH